MKDMAMKTNPQEEGRARAAGRQGACQRVLGQARDTAVPQKGRALCAGCCQHGGQREAGSDGTSRSRRQANSSSDEQTFNTAVSMEEGPQWGQWDQTCQSKHSKGLNWGGRDGDSDPWARRVGGGAEASIISAPGGNPG